MCMKGLSAVVRGHRMGIPKGEVRQLPGVFIIDTFLLRVDSKGKMRASGL